MQAEQLALSSPESGWHGGAVISNCGRYRYHLWRQAPGPEQLRRVLFVMLNPSTADASADDPTIRKCRGFAQRWGFERFDVANLFAWRATDPRELRRCQQDGCDIVGKDNWRWLAQLALSASAIVCAWGDKAKPWKSYAANVYCLLGDNPKGPVVQSLGVSKVGHPRHPLMLSYETQLEELYLGGPGG